ncbi:MAG: cutinase family protein, partial [Mycolicibacterium sp.]|nr:cutinase family protein [Mycolicibacterium sp.]
MAKNTRRRRRHRLLGAVAACAVAVVVALVVTVLVVMIRQPTRPVAPTPPNAQPPTVTTSPQNARPESQPASCPDVQVISIPGTWESSDQDNPVNPTQFPNALLLNVTRPITDQFDGSRVETYTVPYTAQFHNPLSNDKQMSYNDSRSEGTHAAEKAISEMAAKCPLTSYVIAGFSQGAVIAGDIAGDIGNGRGPVDPDLVLGVTLIADGRRQAGVGQDVGPIPP